MLNEAQIHHYRDLGFLLLEGFLDPGMLATLRLVTEELVEKSRHTGKTEHFDILPGHSSQLPLLRKIKKAHRVHPAFDAVRRGERTLAVVQQLLGENVWCNRTKVEMKPAGAGVAFPWHQDWGYLPYTNDDLVRIFVALDDMDPENGGLFIIPGTHRGPVYSHHREGHFVGEVAPEEIAPLLPRQTPVLMKAGAAFAMHIRLLHKSPPNNSSRSRRLLQLEYGAADAWPLLGVSSWEAFAASFVLGAPTVEPRCADVPRRLPLPGLRGHAKV